MSQIHGLVESSKIDTWRLRSESYAGGKLCETGDLVLNRLKAHLGVFAHASIPGVISPDYTVFRPINNIDVRYFEHLYKTPAYKTELRKHTKGIVEGFWRLYSDDFYDLRVIVPPKDEQSKIVAYLDSYNRRIRRLIRNKRRLIGLLSEQKQAIINRAVTRGLNPDAPMKPTGIDWMPEVPVHWEVKRLKQLSDVLFSNVDKHSHEGETPVWLCNYTDVYKNDFIGPEIEFMSATATSAEIERFRLQFGDVMITKDSEAWNDIGVPAIVTNTLDGVLCGYHLIIIRVNSDELLPLFLFRALTAPAVAQQLYVEATGVTRYGLSKLAIKNLLLPCPPVDEQLAVAGAIASALESLDASIGRIRSEITLISEYRERLIADVVTGKLDVRHIKIAAPADEPVSDEDEGLDEEPEADDAEVTEAADADD